MGLNTDPAGEWKVDNYHTQVASDHFGYGTLNRRDARHCETVVEAFLNILSDIVDLHLRKITRNA